MVTTTLQDQLFLVNNNYIPILVNLYTIFLNGLRIKTYTKSIIWPTHCAILLNAQNILEKSSQAKLVGSGTRSTQAISSRTRHSMRSDRIDE